MVRVSSRAPANSIVADSVFKTPGIPVLSGSAAFDVIHQYCLRLPKGVTFKTQMSFIIENFRTETPRFSYVKLNSRDANSPWVETGLHVYGSRKFPIQIAIGWNISDASWTDIRNGTRLRLCDLPRSGINREGILCELSDQVVQCSQSQLENGHGYSLNICVDFSLGIERSQNELTGAATNHGRMGYASSASTQGPSSINGASYRGDGSIVSDAYPRSELGSDYSRGKSRRGNGSIVSDAYPRSEHSTATRASRRTKDWESHAGY
jgi:hypothetical protein